MIIKSINVDAEGVSSIDEALFALDRIELLGYVGMQKQVITEFPREQITLGRRHFVGKVRITGIVLIPPAKQQQEISFFFSPNADGGRPWEVKIIADKGMQAGLIERASFDCRFTLPPANIGIRPSGMLTRIFNNRCSVSSGDVQTQQQRQSLSMETRDGKDIIL